MPDICLLGFGLRAASVTLLPSSLFDHVLDFPGHLGVRQAARGSPSSQMITPRAFYEDSNFPTSNRTKKPSSVGFVFGHWMRSVPAAVLILGGSRFVVVNQISHLV